jgi:hypothetical protein
LQSKRSKLIKWQKRKKKKNNRLIMNWNWKAGAQCGWSDKHKEKEDHPFNND